MTHLQILPQECKELFFYHILLLENEYKYFEMDNAPFERSNELSWKLYDFVSDNKNLYFEFDWGTLHLEMKTPNEVLENIWRILGYEI